MSNEEQKGGLNFFYRLAVLIMSAISAFTTALGAEDLFGLPMAIALAIGLSVLLVAVAFNLPQAYEQGTQWRLIAGYSFIALISVLFNFNYIYGKFAAEDLLYGELTDKREEVNQLEVQAVNTMNKKLSIEDLRIEIKRLDEVMERELKHPLPGESGKGHRYKKAAMQKKLKEEELSVAQHSKKAFYEKMQQTPFKIKTEIDKALNSERDLNLYRTTVESVVTEYNELRNFVQKELPDFSLIPMRFINKDIGKLNHSLWSFTQLSKLSGKQTASLLLAFVIAVAIDFVVLFVLAIANTTTNRNYSTVTTYSPHKRKSTKKQKRTDSDLFG